MSKNNNKGNNNQGQGNQCQGNGNNQGRGNPPSTPPGQSNPPGQGNPPSVPPVQSKKEPRVLFICKRRDHSYGPSFGLINSCRFICNALHQYGIWAEVVPVTDNNCIDAEVTKHKPTHVFIEALWVVPNKFKELIPLHPKVEWYVRIHSKIPFIANEGVAIEWLREYDELSKKYKTLHLSANNPEPIEASRLTYGIKMFYHPNIYCPPVYPNLTDSKQHKTHIDIGCFGAIRPMKNQLLQAMAAISFGNQIKKTIRFHINGDRVEQKGDPVLKNLENAFKNTKYELIKHPWLEHEEFIKLVKKMDLGMQVSFSETFNIVAADFVWNDIPVVGSNEVDWLSFVYKADPNSIYNIINKLSVSWYGKSVNLQRLNKWKLNEYNCESTIVWVNSLK